MKMEEKVLGGKLLLRERWGRKKAGTNSTSILIRSSSDFVQMS